MSSPHKTLPPTSPAEQIVFQTPWFQILSQHPPGFDTPYYSVRVSDFAMVVALNPQGHILVVRQFRPAIGRATLELPAGHVDPGETPEQAAHKELCEETGYETTTLELLATLSPSTSRFTNRAWMFFAPSVQPAIRPAFAREAGTEPLFYQAGLRALLAEEDFIATDSRAALLAAVTKGKLSL